MSRGRRFLAALVVAGCSPGGGEAMVPADLAVAPDLTVVYPAPYAIKVLDDARITSQGAQPNFQHARGAVDLRDGPFAAVQLIVDLRSTCYPFESWKNNPPPSGQSWPADCDAFDRNFELTLDPPAAMSDPPGIEVMRAITPFGGPLHLEIDITDVANGRPGKHTLECVIPTWSDGAGKVSGSNGGWNVSARVEATPGAAPRRVLAVLPLVNGSLGATDKPAPVSFTIPAGTSSTRLEYRATGHGGGNDKTGDCIGPAEEFCQRQQHVTVDGAELESFSLWRNDCDQLCTMTRYAPWNLTYCKENPCGAIASVQASRANWCPGSLTPPRTWDAAPLRAAGKHAFNYSVDGVVPGGSWRISAVLFAFGN